MLLERKEECDGLAGLFFGRLVVRPKTCEVCERI